MDTTNMIWAKISNEKRDAKIRSMLKNHYSSHIDEVIPTRPSNPFNDKNEEEEIEDYIVNISMLKEEEDNYGEERFFERRFSIKGTKIA